LEAPASGAALLLLLGPADGSLLLDMLDMLLQKPRTSNRRTCTAAQRSIAIAHTYSDLLVKICVG
jgi:hypothetical protein